MKCQHVKYVLGIYLIILSIRLLRVWNTQEPNKKRTAHPYSVESPPIVIYNRIPKTGSTSFANLLYNLTIQNKFYILHVNFAGYNGMFSLQDQQEFVRDVATSYRPAVYHGHFAYIDFQQHGSNFRPQYINIIREPLDRLVSYYYFIRYGDDRRVGLKRHKHGENTTFNECVKRGKADCSDRKIWKQIPFFCGHKAKCLEPGNQWALKQAKKNLREKYALVGMTEHLVDFVTLVEKMFPKIFNGIAEMYMTGVNSHLRHTLHKDLISEETLQVFQKSQIYKLESEFYSFAKNHFYSVMAEWT